MGRAAVRELGGVAKAPGGSRPTTPWFRLVPVDQMALVRWRVTIPLVFAHHVGAHDMKPVAFMPEGASTRPHWRVWFFWRTLEQA